MTTEATIEQVRVRVLPDGRMTSQDAARYLGVEDKTLANWRFLGRGPKAHRVGSRVFYYREDLDAYIRSAA